jgi:hypothetical protein
MDLISALKRANEEKTAFINVLLGDGHIADKHLRQRVSDLELQNENLMQEVIDLTESLEKERGK